MSKYEEVTGRIITGFGSIPPHLIRDYIAYNIEVQKGTYDAEFLKVVTIDQIKLIKSKVKFLSEIGQIFLDTRPLVEKYLIDSGQITKERLNGSNDNSGVVRGG